MYFAKRTPACSPDAFTRVELAVVMGTFFTLLLLVLPLLANNAFRSNQIGCLNNLRQIGIAFQAWGNDHDDLRPWFVTYTAPLNQGGTGGHPLRNNAFLHYSCLSNYLPAQLLIDPGETARVKRTAFNWSNSPNGGFLHASFANNAVSYMLGVHGTVLEANEILAGDRHLQFGPFTSCAYGFAPVQNLEADQFFRGWTNGPHGIAGNVLISDGHVEYASQSRLKAILSRQNDDASPGHHMLTPF